MTANEHVGVCLHAYMCESLHCAYIDIKNAKELKLPVIKLAVLIDAFVLVNK